MPKLPGQDSLGARPIPQASRSYYGGGGGGYRPVAPSGSLQLARATEDLGEAIVRGGATIADAERRKKETQDRYEYAAARSAFLQGKVKWDNAFDDDQDYTTYGERYEKGLKDVRAAASAMIRDPEKRKLFEVEIGPTEAHGLAAIGDKARVKEKDVGRGFLLDTINGNRTAALEAKDEATRDALIRSTESSIVSAREKGHISFEEEAKLRESSTESYAERWLQSRPWDEQIKLLAPRTKANAAAPSGDYFSRLAQVESGGNARAINPKSGAAGKYQFLPSTAKAYGIDPMNAEQSEEGVRRFRADNAAVLTGALGRSPTEPEEYLAHQQGAGGASALLRNPDRPAIEVLAEARKSRSVAAKAIVDNGGNLGMTAGDFAQQQMNRFGKDAPIRVAQQGGTIADFLPYDKRAQILDGALKQAAAADERGQKMVDRALTEARDRALKDLADIRAAGRLDTDTVNRYRSVLSGEQYNAWLKTADPKTEEIKDNRSTVSLLEPILGTPEAESLIQREYQLNNLSIPTYVRMVEKNRSLLRDDQPDSPRKSARTFLSDALDPGQLGGDAVMQQPLRIARQRALADLDDWVEANPKVTRQQAMKRASELLEQYQTVGFGEMRLSLPRPRGFTGNKQNVQAQDVENARLSIFEDLDQNKMTKDQAARELDALETWDRVIEKGTKKP